LLDSTITYIHLVKSPAIWSLVQKLSAHSWDCGKLRLHSIGSQSPNRDTKAGRSGYEASNRYTPCVPHCTH